MEQRKAGSHQLPAFSVSPSRRLPLSSLPCSRQRPADQCQPSGPTGQPFPDMPSGASKQPPLSREPPLLRVGVSQLRRQRRAADVHRCAPPNAFPASAFPASVVHTDGHKRVAFRASRDDPPRSEHTPAGLNCATRVSQIGAIVSWYVTRIHRTYPTARVIHSYAIRICQSDLARLQSSYIPSPRKIR
jgi:hypothetical protein